MTWLLRLACVLILALGCGDDSAPSTDSGADVTANDTGTDGGDDASEPDASESDAGEIVCTGEGEPVFPTFDRTCSGPEDCTIALHQSDCCGSIVALGIAASEREAFDAAEAICQPMWPGCRCAPQPTMADDGTNASLGGEPVVECNAGTCTTTYPEG